MGAIVADSSTSAANSHPSVLIVVGAAGDAEFGEQFAQWAKRWEGVGRQADANVAVLGLDKDGDLADRDRLKEVLAEEAKRSLAEMWVVFVGHGTFDGKEAKFNLRGPDVAAGEFSEWLQPFQRPVVLIDCSSASGPFINALSKPGRVVVTATRSGSEQNYARFGDFFSASISDSAADLDKDGQTSLLEAFLMASHRVADFYKNEGRLATEHALLDDNGDGLGTPPDWFRGIRAIKKAAEGASVDGLCAHQIHLVRSKAERELPSEVRSRRDELEMQLIRLRESKDQFPEALYYEKLETLLLDLARLYESSDSKTAPKHAP
ncbi:MAG: hypothetical protein HY735_28125 [Verrucomicrobia bacterium]|nr:hypothetical protein [Verrucomicrobiota bacterium]